MKKIALSLAFAALTFGAMAQQVSRFVVASAGKETGNTTASVDYTFGEMAVSSFTATSAGLPQVTYQLTQGFHQGISTRQLARTATGDWVEMDETAVEQQHKADALAGFDMNVYPNPSSGKVNLDLKGQLTGTTHFILTDAKGQQVLSGELADIQTQLDLTENTPGVYILQVVNSASNLSRTFRFVKS